MDLDTSEMSMFAIFLISPLKAYRHKHGDAWALYICIGVSTWKVNDTLNINGYNLITYETGLN